MQKSIERKDTRYKFGIKDYVEYKKFVIIIPGFNIKNWYAKNLGSVFNQVYQHYRIVYINDCSTDGSGKLVQNFYNKFGKKIPFELINNTTNVGALANIYNAAIKCEDDEIISVLDADDWYCNSLVLQKVNQLFQQNKNMLFLWTQYKNSHNNQLGCSAPFPEEAYVNNSFRQYSWRVSHGHWIASPIIKSIPKEYLYYNGEFARNAYDVLLYLSCMERCGKRAIHIPEVTHIYNTGNPNSDDKRDLSGQRAIAEYGFKMKPLEKIF